MNQMMEEDTSASLQTSVTRTGTTYQLPNVKKEDVQNVPLVYAIWGAARKLKESTAQLSTQAVANVAAAAEKAAADVAALERAAAEQTVAIVAVEQAVAIKADAEAVTAGDNLHEEPKRMQLAEKAAADVAALERAAAEQTVAIVAVEQAVAIKADAQAVTEGDNLHEELKRMQLMLIAERAATATARATARAAADEASATIHILEAENKRLLLLLAAEKAATAASSPVPTNANGHTTHTQHAALANRSNSSTYAQAVMSSVPKVRRPTRNTGNDLGGDHLANAASSSATVGTEPAVMLSPTVLRHNPADNAEAAALQAAADAAAAAAKCNDRAVLRAVLLAAAATAKALAQTGAQDTGTVQPRRRGGRPPPTRTRRANPTRPRRPRKPAGTVAPGPPEPTATGTSTAKQLRWTQQPTASGSPPRGGQKARRQTGTFFTRSDSAVTSLPATRNVPPKIEPTVMHVTGRD